jgi:acyl carrier protein
MELEEIQRIIKTFVKDYLEAQDNYLDITSETVLFGDNTVLDSIGLVNIVIDLESTFLDKGYEISLTSDVAMSRRQSPFRNISTLADFIYEQLNEQ